MKTSTTLVAGAFAQAAFAAIEPKNFIMVIPDGMGPASVTLARTYLAMQDGATTSSPKIDGIAIDLTPVGNTRTHSSNNFVTDSAAAGTALACGYKTGNGQLGVTPDGKPVGSVMEAAKLAGFKTGLVVTSTINHATPGAYSAHSNDRNAFDQIAEQQVGYSHPLNISVDVLFGGGRCSFIPKGKSGSCRGDSIDLFKYAKKNGYDISKTRKDFDKLKKDQKKLRLPLLGLFNDNDLSLEIDRQSQPSKKREPSLSELSEVAIDALHRASKDSDKGFFLMIEASRIDHASHANDPAAHLHDVLEYNLVMELVTSWIDAHPDTAMLSVADHETGGITLPSQYNPSRLSGATQSAEILGKRLAAYTGSDKRGYLTKEIIPKFGLSDLSSSDIDSLLAGSFETKIAAMLSKRAGIAWSTGGHSAVDTTLYAYAAGEMGEQLKIDVAGSHDNTDLPRYIEKILGLDLDETTALLRKDGIDWVPTKQ